MENSNLYETKYFKSFDMLRFSIKLIFILYEFSVWLVILIAGTSYRFLIGKIVM